MKLAVIYHSKTGTTKQMAEIIAEGMMSVEGVEAKCCPIEEIDEAWVQESKCVVVGTPVYVANMSAAVKSWLDGPCKKCGLPGKIGGAFATADYVHGGAEIALQGILSHLLVYGMLTYSGGGALGRPVIHLGPVALREHLEDSRKYFRLYGQRMAMKTVELFA